MSNLKVSRKNVASTFVQFDFDTVASAFLIKNFTSDAILVAFEEDADDSKCIMIAKGMGQLCLANLEIYNVTKQASVWVKGTGTGEVEVQAICY